MIKYKHCENQCFNRQMTFSACKQTGCEWFKILNQAETLMRKKHLVIHLYKKRGAKEYVLVKRKIQIGLLKVSKINLKWKD